MARQIFPQEIKVGTWPLQKMDLTYTAGLRGNISAIEDDADAHSGRDQSFGYDIKDQLVSASGYYGSFAWTYDKLGNRIQQVFAGDTTNYSFGSGANRLVHSYTLHQGSSVESASFGYDVAGGMTSLKNYTNLQLGSSVTLVNNDDSRLASANDGTNTPNNYYDHLGQRMFRTNGGAATLYLYDIFGNLIEEADMDLNPINTYIYLGNHRVAVVGAAYTGSFGCSISHVKESAKANWAIIILVPLLVFLGLRYRKNKLMLIGIALIGGGVIIFLVAKEAKSTLTYDESMYYYHNDHLGTPQVITANNGDVVWDAVYEPFGKINSYAVQTFTNNFRFPGQYEDAGTGMYYNWNRYYMPEVGRYNRPDLLLSITDNTMVYSSICSSISGYVTKSEIEIYYRQLLLYLSIIEPFENNETNSYSYSLNNPVIKIDSNGKSTEPPPGFPNCSCYTSATVKHSCFCGLNKKRCCIGVMRCTRGLAKGNQGIGSCIKCTDECCDK